MTSKPTLLFGGTFDPVHNGHLHLLKMAETHTDYLRVIIMPARISNFKQGTRPADAEDRWQMLLIAIDEYKNANPTSRLELIPSRYEIDKEEVSYTYETVKEVIKTYPIEGKLGFLMGDDLIPSLDKWYNFKELEKHVEFVCFTRDGNKARQIRGAEIKYIQSEVFPSSSSAVREGDFSNLSPGVRNYVRTHRLYGFV